MTRGKVQAASLRRRTMDERRGRQPMISRSCFTSWKTFPECAPFSVARASLSLALVVTRHEDRAPMYGWPSDRVALWEWTSGGGDLAPRGVRAMYDLGRRLQTRYVEDEWLISGTDNRSEV